LELTVNPPRKSRFQPVLKLELAWDIRYGHSAARAEIVMMKLLGRSGNDG
jgi:hypothetical protein